MEAIIRTNDKNLFNSLVQFLKSLHLEVETKKEKSNYLNRKNETIPSQTGHANKKKPSDYAGSLPLKAANEFLKHIEQTCKEWDRDF